MIIKISVNQQLLRNVVVLSTRRLIYLLLLLINGNTFEYYRDYVSIRDITNYKTLGIV